MQIMAFTPVQFTKDGKTVTAMSAYEEVELLYDGWIRAGAAPVDHTRDPVLVSDLADPNSAARQALGPFVTPPTTDAAKEAYLPSRLSTGSLKATIDAEGVARGWEPIPNAAKVAAVTRAQYNALTPDPKTVYIITDDPSPSGPPFVALTQAEYNLLTPDPKTLYIITDAS